MLEGNFEDEQMESMKVFNAVKYISPTVRNLSTLLGWFYVRLMRRDSIYREIDRRVEQVAGSRTGEGWVRGG